MCIESRRRARRCCTSRAVDHRLDDELYREAENTLGTLGLIDMTLLIGIHQGICITFTMFVIPAPDPIVR